MIPKGRDITVVKPDLSVGPILALMIQEKWISHKLWVQSIQGLRKGIPLEKYGRR